jgi:hypothetical protein
LSALTGGRWCHVYCTRRWANAKVKIIVVVAVLLLVLTIFLLACFAGNNNCTKRS